MRRLIVTLIAAASLGVVTGAVMLWLYTGARAAIVPADPPFEEAAWPLPPDPWGKGKFFQCGRDRCGVDVRLYVRAKIGFCRCDIGVSDDEELDRIGDLALFSDKATPLASGRPIAVRWMKGRSRAFSLRDTLFAKSTALSVGFNDRCDAIVATAVVDGPHAAALEPAIVKFLNSDTVVEWATVTLGL
ncbi:hypothetical protein [Pseudorhodoplanes sp.]|uniref:hypothetical protein n=1 Tax=Pseudorhodoplanes sp. TaxID=1934341 RepID=UPI002C2A3E34|nr:hypothetical protein [Pseudorhodoplanes sp.]HWV53993.1 hypothetical protein [Pseudorhodoplanes sp.]